ncbi:MAG TPA: PilN domain-containing protein [Gammaproteobacteria bacterium]|nr:PilN domain-containing protein [Gammaproteobacteria bacterium]
MVVINLLPWREYNRRYENKITNIILLASITLTILIVMVIHVYLSQELKKLENAVDALRQQIKKHHDLDRVVYQQKESALAFKKLTNHFENYYNGTRNLFNELEQYYPQKLCFTEIHRHQNTVRFFGYVYSMTDLADFLMRWHAIYLFTEIKIEQIDRNKEDRIQFYFKGKEKIHTDFFVSE